MRSLDHPPDPLHRPEEEPADQAGPPIPASQQEEEPHDMNPMEQCPHMNEYPLWGRPGWKG